MHSPAYTHQSYTYIFTDCNDIHESGVELSVEPTVHDLFVTYSDGERVKTRVLCKHDASHTAGHDTIDNRINSQLTIDTTTTAGRHILVTLFKPSSTTLP